MSGQTNYIRRKLDRLRGGEAPRCWDVFGGCGGLSLGFHSAHFEIAAAVELDADAVATHAHNFHRAAASALLKAHSKPRDITRLEPAELLTELGSKGNPAGAVDVLLGGPPCQAYARVGRAKLREVANHPTAFLEDARGKLFERYLHYVEVLKPLGLVMENVPDVLNYGGRNIAEEICDRLDELGYESSYTLLNAAFYSIPQTRERVFLCGWSRQLGAPIEYPKPTHWTELPAGYRGSRSVALRTLRSTGATLFDPPKPSRYVDPPSPFPSLPPAGFTHYLCL